MTEESVVLAVGVALLRRQGVPEHVARQSMHEDPECQRITEQVVPVLARLVQRLNAVLQSDPSESVPAMRLYDVDECGGCGKLVTAEHRCSLASDRTGEVER